jgi:tetratricopeptide (TPR) repeat protein
VRRHIATSILATALLSSMLVTSTAAAQTGAPDAAEAEVLFQQAQTLFSAGKYAEACPKFAASYELDAGLGTLLNLARCYEKAGKTASAWVAYVDLAPLAARAGQPDRADIAQQRIAALEPNLMRLKLEVPADANIVVTLDDKPLAPELYGSALPVDPGDHAVAAHRPDGEPYFTKRVAATEPGRIVVVVVEPPPALAAPPPSPPPTPSPAPPPSTPPSVPKATPAPEPEPGTPWFIAGGVIGGAGLVALGIAGGFTADAASSWKDARCDHGLCPDAKAQASSEHAGRSADVATGLAVAGGVVAAAGAVLVLVGLTTSGDEGPLSFDHGGLGLRF